MELRYGVAAVAMAAVAGVGIAACDSATGPEDAATVAVSFRAVAAGAAALRAPDASGRLATSMTSSGVDLAGSNGTLSLEEVWFIVSEFELEQVESACRGAADGVSASRADGDDEHESDDDDDGAEHECEEFEAPPSFVQLPLDGADVPAVSRPVAPGVYRNLEFEVEDIEVDDGDDAGDVQALFDEIRALFPDWPEEASMLVIGTFTPTGGAPAPFRVFFEAEIEIEREFQPPLDLGGGEDATVTVIVDPSRLFVRPDGTVMDLAQFDGQVVEFESEMEEGFTGVESDDRHPDD